MLDVAPTELMIVAVIALLVIGPKDLPRVMRSVGNWVGKARGMARHFRSGIDAMMREAELEEMEKQWREENERIMRAFPDTGPLPPTRAIEDAVTEPVQAEAAPAPAPSGHAPEPELPLGAPAPPKAPRKRKQP